jgi:predicted peptidase
MTLKNRKEQPADMKLCKAFSVFLAAILLIGSIPILQVSAATVSSVNDMDALFLSRSIAMENGGTMNYRLYIPADYDPQQAYPVVLFLHGAGERGDDNLKQLKAGIIEPFKQENNPIYGCIVIAPQCPAGKQWVNTSGWAQSVYSIDETPETEELKTVLKIVKEVQATYSTNPDRLYVTGLSMGGYGTWDLLTRHPELFAAAIPVCGGADPSKAERLLSIPIWTFHGLLDERSLPQAHNRWRKPCRRWGQILSLSRPCPIWTTISGARSTHARRSSSGFCQKRAKAGPRRAKANPKANPRANPRANPKANPRAQRRAPP